MPHRLQAIRHDILTAIDEIRGFVAGRTLQELLADRGFQLILEREFEIIGEALYRIRNIDSQLFERIPSAHRIIGMRNILAHGYDRVDYRILWDAARLELESLRNHVESL
jgi:uncharacterized protein with HEPN domain